MCLIIYSSKGNVPARADFYEAANDNPDGIGVMSADGIRKFLGKKATKKAWKYVQSLAGMPFGIHFRWATHGEITRANCHPFKVPGIGFAMHNGILWTSTLATKEESDTAIFCRDFLPSYGEMLGATWRADVEKSIGLGNKLLVMSDDGRTFRLCNEHAGEWLDGGLWFSNTYSVVSDPTVKASWRRYAAYSPGGERGYGWQDPYTAATRGTYPTLASEMLDDDWQEPWEVTRDLEEAEAALAGEVADGRIDSNFWREAREAARKVQAQSLASAVKSRPWKKATGFDWHDPKTWTKYPIPGSEGRALNRFGKDEPDADGVQEYV